MGKIAITGMSMLSTLGIDKNAHQTMLHGGQLPSGFYRDYWNRYLAGEAGRVPFFDPKEYIRNPKTIKLMSRQTVLACTAASQAIRNAGLCEGELQQEQYQNALVFGTGVNDSIFPMLPAIVKSFDTQGNIDYQKLGESGYRNLPPLWILEKLPNTTAGQIAIQNSIRGLNYTVVNGPINGILAVALGSELLEQQRASRVICGASESYAHADYIYQLEKRGIISQTENGVKPFDEGSDGCYLAEGSSAFVMEDEETAHKRGIRIQAWVLSFKNSYLPLFVNHEKEYTALLLEKCIRGAIEEAGLSPGDIDFIQANGCGYPELDIPEAMAIHHLFGRKPAITTCVPLTGYTLGASGALSVAFALLQLEHNLLLPIGRTQRFYCQEDLNFVVGKPLQKELKTVLINSFSYMGDACCIIMRKGDN